MPATSAGMTAVRVALGHLKRGTAAHRLVEWGANPSPVMPGLDPGIHEHSAQNVVVKIAPLRIRTIHEIELPRA